MPRWAGATFLKAQNWARSRAGPERGRARGKEVKVGMDEEPEGAGHSPHLWGPLVSTAGFFTCFTQHRAVRKDILSILAAKVGSIHLTGRGSRDYLSPVTK